MPLSKKSLFFLPPSPESLATTNLPSVSVVLITPGSLDKEFYFCDWYILLSTVSSRFMHIGEGVRIYFFKKLCNILLYMYTTICLAIHSLLDSWIASETFWLFCSECCYEYGWTNISSSCAFFSFGCILRSGIAGSYGKSIFNFLKESQYCSP